MNVSIQKLEDNKVELTITIPQTEVSKAYESAYKKLAQEVNIPGFRKGKAPRKIIESRLGAEAIKEEAENILVNDSYRKALQQEHVEVVSYPSIDIIESDESKDMEFKAVVTVRPEVELGEYTDLEVEKGDSSVTDEDVMAVLDKLREKKAQMVVVENAELAKGDFAIIDFAGYIDGEPFSGGEGKGYPLEIGSGSFIPGFEDQLIGAKTGEERTVKVNFPEDYFSKDLAGKEAEFKVNVQDIKQKQLPEATDEFIKENTEFATLEEWKADCRKNLEESKKIQVKNEHENNLIKTAVENAKIDVPEIMVEERIKEILRDMAAGLQQRGLKFEDYLKYIGKTLEEVKESYKETALADVKAELVMEAIAAKENLEVTAADLEKELEEMAKQYKKTAEEIKKTLVKTGNIVFVNMAILRRKAARLIIGEKEENNEDSK